MFSHYAGIDKPKSKVQSPKVKTKRTRADTIITWATHPTTTNIPNCSHQHTQHRRRVARDQE